MVRIASPPDVRPPAAAARLRGASPRSDASSACATRPSPDWFSRLMLDSPPGAARLGPCASTKADARSSLPGESPPSCPASRADIGIGLRGGLLLRSRAGWREAPAWLDEAARRRGGVHPIRRADRGRGIDDSAGAIARRGRPDAASARPCGVASFSCRSWRAAVPTRGHGSSASARIVAAVARAGDPFRASRSAVERAPPAPGHRVPAATGRVPLPTPFALCKIKRGGPAISSCPRRERFRCHASSNTSSCVSGRGCSG